MSIVGCYSLDLYCDNGSEAWHDYKVKFPHQYTAETGSDCRKQARQAGWKLNWGKNTAYCPACVKQGKVPKST